MGEICTTRDFPDNIFSAAATAGTATDDDFLQHQQKEKTNKKNKFSIFDFYTFGDNAAVINQFFRFCFALAVFPIVTFYLTQHVVLVLNLPLTTDGSTAGAVVSLIVLLILMALYAYRAYNEEHRDYYAQKINEKREGEGAAAAACSVLGGALKATEISESPLSKKSK